MNIQGDLQAKGRTFVIEFLGQGEAKSQSYKDNQLPRQVCFLLLRMRILEHTPWHPLPEPAY